MPHRYPIFVDLTSRLVVVVGAGPVGARKAAGAAAAGAGIRLVAPAISKEAERVIHEYDVEVCREQYGVDHLNGAGMVFAATDCSRTNAGIVKDAQIRNILVSSADDPDSADFIVPAVLRRGELSIAISTGGASPKLAARIEADLAELYGPEYAGYVDLLHTMRARIKELTQHPARRAAALEALIDSRNEICALLAASGNDAALRHAENLAVSAMELID